MYAQAPQLPATSARPLYSLRKVQGQLKGRSKRQTWFSAGVPGPSSYIYFPPIPKQHLHRHSTLSCLVSSCPCQLASLSSRLLRIDLEHPKHSPPQDRSCIKSSPLSPSDGTILHEYIRSMYRIERVGRREKTTPIL